MYACLTAACKSRRFNLEQKCKASLDSVMYFINAYYSVNDIREEPFADPRFVVFCCAIFELNFKNYFLNIRKNFMDDKFSGGSLMFTII